MLLGQVRSNLDDNHGLVIPPSFRDIFQDGAYITRGFDRNLILIPTIAFEEIARQTGALNITDPLARMLSRLILGNATRLELDGSGHVTLPQELLASAGLKKDVILVGQGDYCEIWTPDDWALQNTELLDSAANANRFAQLDLTFK
jgi:MraZ protein